MDYSNEYDDGEIKMLNGRSIMNALAFLNYQATENELLKHIVTETGHPQNLIKREIQRTLDYGVTNGFLMKSDDKYVLPQLANVHHVDKLPPKSKPTHTPPSSQQQQPDVYVHSVSVNPHEGRPQVSLVVGNPPQLPPEQDVFEIEIGNRTVILRKNKKTTMPPSKPPPPGGSSGGCGLIKG